MGSLMNKGIITTKIIKGKKCNRAVFENLHLALVIDLK
jgi:hypothetical protein